MASVAELTQWYWEWQEGRSKNDIELVELNDPASHGKNITALWRSIGLETEKPHPMVVENERLLQKLKDHGIEP